MTERKRKKYSEKIKLDSLSLNKETGRHSFEVKTTYMGDLSGQIEVFSEPKVLTSSYSGNTFKVIGEVLLDGYSDKITIYYNENTWGTSMSGTLIKDSENRGQAWINLAKVLSMGDKQDYQLWIVENEQDTTTDEIIGGLGQEDELPFS